jgi:uncharacterized membrane protein YtjA (UPF0391 family)
MQDDAGRGMRAMRAARRPLWVSSYELSPAKPTVAPVVLASGCGEPNGDVAMLHYAVVFLVIALIAAVFGFTGIAAGAAGIAKILFVVFLIGAAITFFMGLGRRA